MTIEKTLAERGARYGKFADHAIISQGIQDVMRNAPRWDNLDQDMKQALSTIADKIARILNGDPYYGDNWHDIIGYAKLIEDRINMLSSSEVQVQLYEGPVNKEVETKINSILMDDKELVSSDPLRHYGGHYGY